MDAPLSLRSGLTRGISVGLPQSGQEPLLLARQVDVLELIARDSPLDAVLEKICRMAEEFVPGSLAGVTILDRAGHAFEGCVMPSAPTFAAAIAGIEVGPPMPAPALPPSIAECRSPAPTRRRTSASIPCGGGSMPITACAASSPVR